MKKVEFVELIGNLDKLINDSDIFREKYHKANNAENLSIKDFNESITVARSLLGRHDKIVGSDVYHIIGMGNLSASQMSIFTKKIKSLGIYRNELKWFAGNTPIKLGIVKDGESTYQTSILSTKLQAERI